MAYFDHGAPGHVMMPEEALFADTLNETIKHMFNNKQYAELVLLIEACESGSMLEYIDLQSMNAWGLTATNATNPSFGTYCYPHDKVKGEHLYTCLGDLFAVSWMEFLETNERKLPEMTIQQFYDQIYKRTQAKSMVQKFGSHQIEN